eukprot:351979-Lingulodinium_polyedra.AAC.1
MDLLSSWIRFRSFARLRRSAGEPIKCCTGVLSLMVAGPAPCVGSLSFPTTPARAAPAVSVGA